MDELPGRSVKSVRHERGGRRRLTSRLADEQVRELVAAFEASATRMELDERYGIGRTSVAKLLRAWREKQTQEDVAWWAWRNQLASAFRSLVRMASISSPNASHGNNPAAGGPMLGVGSG